MSRSNASSPARAAFKRALELVRSDQPNAIPSEWLDHIHTIDDVKNEIEKAKQEYEFKPKSVVREWLEKFSLSIMQYARVLDVLVQHHPEYVSLAWGTTKFLFILFQNREELLSELTKAFVKLNGLLPRVQIQADLFKTVFMQQLVEMLYAEIVRFYHATLKFYEEGRAMRIWKSFIKPFSLRFAGITESIDLLSRMISELAAAHSQQRQQEDIAALTRQVQNLLVVVEKKFAAQNSLALGHISMTKDMHTAGMIEAAKSDTFQDPCDVLEFRVSLCRRRHKQQAINIDPVWKSASLTAWSSAPESAILIVQGSLSKKIETLAVGTLMTQFVQSEQMPVLWALQNATHDQPLKTTPLQILKYLAMQALRLQRDTIDDHISGTFNQTRISSARTAQDWIVILKSALAGVLITYILVDLDLMDLEDSSTMLSLLLQSLLELTEMCKPTVLKIVLINKLRTVNVNLQSGGAETLNLEQVLRSDTKVSRLRSRRQANNGPLRGTASSAFRSRLRGQNSVRVSN